MPAKADTIAQRNFYENKLLPLMEKAKNGEIALLFLDASHFVMGCDFLGCIYGKTRRFIKTFSGRKRYNVLGALDFVTKKVITVVNDTYINAEQVKEILEKINEEYKGKTVHLILDNARYQKCETVFNLAKQLGIVLEYIPPYSPNLNLIERLWKFVKGELRKKFYDQFDVFKTTINSIIQSTSSSNKSKFDELISEKVQLFDSLCPIDENTMAYPKSA